MGDAAEMILDGFMCQVCGEMIDGDEPGYPRCCAACESENEEEDC